MYKLSFLFVCIIFCLLTSCVPMPQNVIDTKEHIEIYPDYEEVTIPINIAPLNFLIRDESVDAVAIKVKGSKDSLTLHFKGRQIVFPLRKWKQLMDNHPDDTLTISIITRKNNRWLQHPSFHWNTVSDKIDPYLSYRLIEPGYEVWNRLQIKERCIENFDEKTLADNKLLDGKCMNCHIYGNNQGNLSMFHLRGQNGGTILNRNGDIRKLSLKNNETISAAIYGNFHPNGRYGIFSTNIIIPGFHTTDNKRLEVYDTESDLVIVDFDKNEIITSPLTSDSLSLETFPVFSADGQWVYFCTAPAVALPDSIQHLRYSLCRIAFDASSRQWGNQVDTVWNASAENGSVCHPKTSPNGKYLLYTVADYGTFPIWHRETDLQLMNLDTGETNQLEKVNSNRSDTYHSWSSNSRWFAFASKRGDGQYGRVYFAYIDENGNAAKPFVLPQANPEHDDLNLKSYNIPELSISQVPFDANTLELLIQQTPSEPFN